jgi:hypothetical protein
VTAKTGACFLRLRSQSAQPIVANAIIPSGTPTPTPTVVSLQLDVLMQGEQVGQFEVEFESVGESDVTLSEVTFSSRA